MSLYSYLLRLLVAVFPQNLEYPSAPEFKQTTNGLWCCHQGPPGCYCDIVRYESPDGRTCLVASGNGTVVQLSRSCGSKWDEWGNDTWRETWYTYEAMGHENYVQVENWGETGSDTGNSYKCLAPKNGCKAGERLILTPCAEKDPLAWSLTSWTQSGGTRTKQIGQLTSDSCPGMCVARTGGQVITLEPCRTPQHHVSVVLLNPATVWTRLFLD